MYTFFITTNAYYEIKARKINMSLILLGKTSVSMYYNGRNLLDSLKPFKKKAVLKEQLKDDIILLSNHFFCGVMPMKSSEWKPFGVEKKGGL